MLFLHLKFKCGPQMHNKNNSIHPAPHTQTQKVCEKYVGVHVCLIVTMYSTMQKLFLQKFILVHIRQSKMCIEVSIYCRSVCKYIHRNYIEM